MSTDASTGAGAAGGAALLPGFAVTALTPDDTSALACAMLIALLASEGGNVAAMVPVETGVDDPCEQGSRGALIRWAAGHLDNPRDVTPFALEHPRSAMHAADASGTLLHHAAFDRAREELSDGRSVLVVHDAVGLLDPISPSQSMLEMVARWRLSVVIVEPVTRWAVGHVRLIAAALLAHDVRIAGVILADAHLLHEEPEIIGATCETLGALLECPVVLMPRVISVHDRGELLTAAHECGLHRITARRLA
ncbi:MAG: AAA family ATPase [Gemmatimonadaceae bacterium]|nr:AAA family ATPase [Gemmatimonadaceae bacterium]